MVTKNPTTASQVNEILRIVQAQTACVDFSLMAERQEKLTEIVDKLHKAMFGNGNVGALEDVRELKRAMSIIARVTWSVIGIIITVAIGAIIYLIATHPVSLIP